MEESEVQGCQPTQGPKGDFQRRSPKVKGHTRARRQQSRQQGQSRAPGPEPPASLHTVLTRAVITHLHSHSAGTSARMFTVQSPHCAPALDKWGHVLRHPQEPLSFEAVCVVTRRRGQSSPGGRGEQGTDAASPASSSQAPSGHLPSSDRQ